MKTLINCHFQRLSQPYKQKMASDGRKFDEKKNFKLPQDVFRSFGGCFECHKAPRNNVFFQFFCSYFPLLLHGFEQILGDTTVQKFIFDWIAALGLQAQFGVREFKIDVTDFLHP